MAEVFICYTTNDTAMLAQVLHKRLEQCLGERAVFLDHATLTLGEDYRPELWNHLRLAKVLLVLIGPHWLVTSESGIEINRFVEREIETGLREVEHVIPVLCGPAGIPADLPISVQELKYRQYALIPLRGSYPGIDVLCDKVVRIVGGWCPPGHGTESGLVVKGDRNNIVQGTQNVDTINFGSD